jgi:hypothetical protein
MEAPAPHLHRVNERDGKFEVLNDSSNVVLVCQDEASATNYAILLSEAFQRGYKAGYRDGKNLKVGARKD